MPQPDFPSEMKNIPYEEIIGGPLNAAVDANAEASRTAANFIQNVAFKSSDSGFSVFSDAKEPRYVTFNYHKQTTVDESGNPQEEEFELKVPLLLLLHVPYFEVSRVTIDFNVKLNSIHKRMVSESGGGGLSVPTPWFSVSGSYQRTDKRSEKIQRSYDQSVHVEAGSIEPPEGVTRILDVLEQTITETSGSEASNGSSSNNDGPDES
jgi:hypothetical protein